MIPEFNENGYLPPGLHHATLDEIAARFGSEPELRQVQMESLRWLVDLARRAGALRLVINGSFVTDCLEPGDIDCVLLTGANFPKDATAEAELIDGLPFIALDLAGQELFREIIEVTFATDRNMILKGMVEILL